MSSTQNFIDEVKGCLGNKYLDVVTKKELKVVNQRITNLASLSDGSTTGDAELMDIRVAVDGTIYDTAGDAVRGQVGELKSELDKQFEKYLVYTPEKIGFYSKSGNTLVFIQSSNYISKVIDVNESEKYYLSMSETGASCMPYFRLCDDNLKVLHESEYSSEDITLNDLEVRIPNNVTKLVITASRTIGLKDIIIKKSVKKIDVVNGLVSENASFIELKTVLESGYYYSANGVATKVESNSWLSTVIDVEETEKYLLTLSITGISAMPLYRFCDDNLNIIYDGEIKTEDVTYTDYEVIIPHNVTKLVLSASSKIGVKTIDVKKYVLNGTKALELCESLIKKPLSKYSYIAFGDSITATSSRWRDEFIEKTGANEIACYAVGGAHLCDYSDTVLDGNPTGSQSANTVCNQVYQMLQNPPTEIPDFVIISAGTNDNVTPKETLDNRALPNFQNDVGEYRSGKQFIDIDSVDRTAWDGAMRWQAEKIWSVYPNTKIIFIAPIQSADFHTRPVWSILAKGQLMEYISNNMGCYTIQAGAECGIWARFETDGSEGKYLADGLHPNIEGGKVLGRYIANEIISMFTV